MTLFGNRLRMIVVTFAAALLAAAWLCSPTAAKSPELGENEVKLGKEAAAAVAKEHKLSTNEADLKRIRAIGAKLAEVANTKTVSAVYGADTITKFDYQFDIIEDKDINAFCVPGGHIYIFRGLLDFVQSDDELAAVIAHETTHAAHHHMVFLLKRQAALENAQAIALLATIMSGAKGSDVFNIAQGITLFNIAKLNGYGMQAERDADAGAIHYMMQAGYNPVGLLTFMERLARRPEFVDLGIYRSHPLDADRIKAAKDLLTKLKVPIDRRAVTNAAKAIVTVEKVGEVDVPGVVLSEKVLYRPSAPDAKQAQQLAQAAADRINQALDSGVKVFEIKTDASAGAVTARNNVLISFSDADARLMGTTPAQAAQAAATVIKNVVIMQMVDTVH